MTVHEIMVALNAGEPAPGMQPTWNTVAGTADLFNLGH